MQALISSGTKGLTITLHLGDDTHIIDGSHPNFDEIRAKILDNNLKEEEYAPLLSIKESLEKWSYGEFTIKEDSILFRDTELPKALNSRILEFHQEGKDPSRFFRFWERLKRNPSYRSVTTLWNFLEYIDGIHIDEDGYIIAYKGVRDDFYSVRGGGSKNTRILNSLGAVISEPRNEVSDDPTIACDRGLHVGSLQYAKGWGDRVIVVRVDPEHVVCVMNDYKHQKMRVCEYTVIGLSSDELISPTGDLELPSGGTETVESEEAEISENAGLHGDTTIQSGLEISIPRTGTAWDYMNDLDSILLNKQTLSDLRKYACHNCFIVKASKTPGGKTALIRKIIESRGYNNPSERAA